MLIISLRLEVQLLYFVCIYVSTSFVYNDPVSSGELCWLMSTLVDDDTISIFLQNIYVDGTGIEVLNAFEGFM